MANIYAFFQSTLLQEERRLRILSTLLLLMTFNPRSYKRSDGKHEKFNWKQLLSIHAPTRGATVLTMEDQKGKTSFNPRSYKRSDHGRDVFINRAFSFNPRSYKRSDIHLHLLINEPLYFQSTLLQEERHVTGELIYLLTNAFNPRSYKRSDKIQLIHYH